MKPEALDALTTPTMRPEALEAATVQENDEKSPEVNSPPCQQAQPAADSNAASMTSTPPRSASDGSGPTTDGTSEDNAPTAATIVSEVVQSVKSAVDSAIAWAEQKVDDLSAEQDSTGPYTSPATCMPSDLDVIASGILPAMPTERQYDGGVDDEKKKGAECSEESTRTGDGEGKKKGEE